MVGEAHLPSSRSSAQLPSQAALQAQEQQARTAAWLSNSCCLPNMLSTNPNQGLGAAQHETSASRQASWPAQVAEQHLIGVASFPQGAQGQQQQQQQHTLGVATPSAPAPQLTYLGEVQEQLVHAYPTQPSVLHVSPRYSGSLVWPGHDSGVGYVLPEQQQV